MMIKIRISNPFKTWWKARKYFKFPHITFHFSSDPFVYPYASKTYQGKILDIWMHDVIWKSKWDSSRHERDPLIYICLFGTYSMGITFGMSYKDEFGDKKDGSMEYWEYLLDYLYFGNNLKSYSAWSTDSKLYKNYDNKPFKCIVPCVAISLNKRGIKKLKKELNEEGRNTESN